MVTSGFLDIATTATEDRIRMIIRSDDPDALPVIDLLIGRDYETS